MPKAKRPIPGSRHDSDALTPTMQAALRVIRHLGRRDAALGCPHATLRALFRRGVIDSALNITEGHEES